MKAEREPSLLICFFGSAVFGEIGRELLAFAVRTAIPLYGVLSFLWLVVGLAYHLHYLRGMKLLQLSGLPFMLLLAASGPAIELLKKSFSAGSPKSGCVPVSLEGVNVCVPASTLALSILFTCLLAASAMVFNLAFMQEVKSRAARLVSGDSSVEG